MVPGAGLEPARLAAGDFESPESTNFTTRAVIGGSALWHTRRAKNQPRTLSPALRNARIDLKTSLMVRSIGVRYWRELARKCLRLERAERSNRLAVAV